MATKNMVSRLLLILSLFIACVSCKYETNITREIVVNSYLSDSLVRSFSLKVDVIKDEECSIYIYSNKDSVTTIFSILKVCDSIAYYNNVECSILEIKQYEVDKNKYEVVTYLFDVKHSDDEELLLFFHPEYGLLVEYSEHWLLSKTFESDYITKRLAFVIKREQSKVLPRPTGL